MILVHFSHNLYKNTNVEDLLVSIDIDLTRPKMHQSKSQPYNTQEYGYYAQ